MATVLERVTKLAVDRLGVEEEDVKVESSFTEDLNADSRQMKVTYFRLYMGSDTAI